MDLEYKKQFEGIDYEKPKLLLHICCAPDLVVPLIDLKNYFKLYLYWYNPNIQPYEEYARRYKEYIKLLNLEEWDYELVDSDGNLVKEFDDKIFNEYNIEEFYDKLYEYRKVVGYNCDDKATLLKNFAKMEEKDSPRCDICYYMRLLEPALVAKKLGIKYFTTTLLISPKKSVEKLNKYWQIVATETGIKYLSFDFRKNNWFKRAADYTREKWIWRQNYCGCGWSINY